MFFACYYSSCRSLNRAFSSIVSRRKFSGDRHVSTPEYVVMNTCLFGWCDRPATIPALSHALGRSECDILFLMYICSPTFSCSVEVLWLTELYGALDTLEGCGVAGAASSSACLMLAVANDPARCSVEGAGL